MDLGEAFAALRRGEPARCLELLEGAEPAPADLPRVWAWRAQAYERLGRLPEADRALLEAIRGARALGEVEAVRQLRAIQARVVAGLAAAEELRRRQQEDRALLDRDEAALDEDERLRKATVLLDDGEVEAARRVLDAVKGEEPRTRVLRLLALARCGDPAEAIRAAHRVADDAGDPNLVTAVAHAARAAGVRLEPPSFG